MAMRVRYTMHNGRLVGENRGGTKRDYVPDPLGSTVALLDNTQAQTDTFGYWPYGEERTRTGATATPFRFGGSRGYYYAAALGLAYVRARTLDGELGRWMTPDPLTFRARARQWRPHGQHYNAWEYVNSRPTALSDPSGLVPLVVLGAIFGIAFVLCVTRSIVATLDWLERQDIRNDDFRHCAVACEITRSCPLSGGFVTCDLAAVAWEAYDALRGIVNPSYGWDSCDIFFSNGGCVGGMVSNGSCEDVCSCLADKNEEARPNNC